MRTKQALYFALSIALLAATLGTHQLVVRTPVAESLGAAFFEVAEAGRKARFSAELSKREPEAELPVPVLGVEKGRIADTYGEPRSGGRSHEGVDIFAPRGAHVMSATEGIVRRIGVNELGGNYVTVLGPGGERFYYAHLDGTDPHLRVGDIIPRFALLGTVGTTGNASGTPPHLHFGVYRGGEAGNPFDRLRTRERGM